MAYTNLTVGAVVVGNTAGTASFTVNCGTGGANFGTSANAHATTVGSTNSTSSTTLQSGSGALAVTSTNGTLTINSGTGALSISSDASATTVTIATGAAVKTTTLGSTNSTSATTVQSGSGTLSLTATNGAITANSGTGTVSVSTDATNNTLNIGTGAGVKTLTVGSTNSTSATVIQAGSGGVKLGTTKYPITSASSGKIIISDGTDFIASTPTYPNAAGTSGNLLTSNGTNFVSSSPAGLGASLVFLSQKTAAASASLDFTSIISSTYNNYYVIISGIVPATNSVQFKLQVSTDNGSNWIATNYQAGYTFTAYNSATENNVTATTFFPMSSTGAPNSDPAIAGFLNLFDVTNGKVFKMAGNLFIFQSVAGFGCCGGYNTATSVNALRFIMSSGNITSGTISLYGIREA